MTSEHVVAVLALLVVLAGVLMLAGAAVLWEAAHPGGLRAVLGIYLRLRTGSWRPLLRGRLWSIARAARA